MEDHFRPAILEMLNSLLSAGQVPGLYSHDELDPLLAPLKDIMGEEGFAYRTPMNFSLAGSEKSSWFWPWTPHTQNLTRAVSQTPRFRAALLVDGHLARRCARNPIHAVERCASKFRRAV